MKAAQDANVRMKLGLKVVNVDVGKTTITLENGELIDADLIIGADGIQVGPARSIHLRSCSEEYPPPVGCEAPRCRHKTPFPSPFVRPQCHSLHAL